MNFGINNQRQRPRGSITAIRAPLQLGKSSNFVPDGSAFDILRGMSEKPPAVEQGPERQPSEAEVGSLFEKLTEGKEFTEVRKLEDEHGLYLWDIKVTDEQGEVTEYSYMRKGQYPEGKAIATAVHVAFYDSEGFPLGGHSVAKYREGEWTDTI